MNTPISIGTVIQKQKYKINTTKIIISTILTTIYVIFTIST